MKFFISLPNPELARGNNPELSFSAHGAEALAEQLQNALSNPAYSQAWLSSLHEDDAEHIDAQLLAIDADAKVSGAQKDLGIDLIVDTKLNGSAFKHRLRLLAGSHWLLKDVW